MFSDESRLWHFCHELGSSLFGSQNGPETLSLSGSGASGACAYPQKSCASNRLVQETQFGVPDWTVLYCRWLVRPIHEMDAQIDS